MLAKKEVVVVTAAHFAAEKFRKVLMFHSHNVFGLKVGAAFPFALHLTMPLFEVKINSVAPPLGACILK